MKKVFSILMVLALTLGVVTAAMAQVPAPGGPFNSEFSVQNLEASDALCSYSFYNADESSASYGDEAFTSAATSVAAGDSLTVYVPGVGGLASGSYSAVVSCDRKVAAITNFSDADSGASHEGITDPADTWYAPGIYDNFYTYMSDVVVQNASSANVDIDVEIYEPGNPAPVLVQSKDAVPPNASATFEQEGLTELANNVAYSAVIKGTGAIAPVVNIFGTGGTAQQLYSYNPFKEGSTTAFAPVLYNKYYTYDTSLTIQNIGTETATVEVTYTGLAPQNYNIAAHASLALYTPASGLAAGNVLYSAVVESTNEVPIVLLVNESNPNQRAASYTGFATGSTTAVAPFVAKNYYTFDSSVNCQNLGTVLTDMTITYATGTPGGSTTIEDVAPGATAFFYQPNDPALAGVGINFKTAATVTSGQPIVCVVNYDFIPAKAGEILDQLYSYEGIAP